MRYYTWVMFWQIESGVGQSSEFETRQVLCPVKLGPTYALDCDSEFKEDAK